MQLALPRAPDSLHGSHQHLKSAMWTHEAKSRQRASAAIVTTSSALTHSSPAVTLS